MQKGSPTKALAFVALAVAVLWILIILTGCQPVDGNGKDPVGRTADYVLRIVSLDERTEAVRRHVACTLVAYRADAVVTIRDVKTGEVKPYDLLIEDTTPVEITIYKAKEAERIEYICTMRGYNGDSMDCEVRDSKGRMAPLSGSVDFDLIEGPKGRLLEATCGGTIQVQS